MTSVEQAEAKEKEDALAAQIKDGFREIMALDQLLKDKQTSSVVDAEVGEKSNYNSSVDLINDASTNDKAIETMSTFMTDLPILHDQPFQIASEIVLKSELPEVSLMDDEQLQENIVIAQTDYMKRNMEVKEDTSNLQRNVFPMTAEN